MPWRAPRYALLHAAQAAGTAAITPASEDAAFPKANLIDDRADSVFKFAASAALLTIDLDRGVDFASLDPIDRLYIPLGHNVTGTIVVGEDDNPAFDTPSALLISVAQSPASPVDEQLQASTERFIRLTFNDNDLWVIPQLIYSQTLALVRGPNPDTWKDDVIDNVDAFEKDSGVTSYLVKGGQRERFEFTYSGVSGADLATLDAIFEHGEGNPYLLDPPYDTRPAVWVTTTAKSRQNDHTNPAGVPGEVREYQLTALEHVA